MDAPDLEKEKEENARLKEENAWLKAENEQMKKAEAELNKLMNCISSHDRPL